MPNPFNRSRFRPFNPFNRSSFKPHNQGVLETGTTSGSVFRRGGSVVNALPLAVKASLGEMGVDANRLPEVVARDIARLSPDELQSLAAIKAKLPSTGVAHGDDDGPTGYVVF